jgi:hypothetical protein
MRSSLVACALLLGGLALACTGNKAPEAMPAPLLTGTASTRITPSATAVPVTFIEPTGLTTAPRGDRTGIDGVDSAIAEIDARDIEALATRLRFVDLQCIDGEDFEPSPACAEGEPPGTTVAVFRHGVGCHMQDLGVPGLLVLSFHLEGREIVTVTDGCGLAPLDFRAHRYTATRAAEVILRGPAFPPDSE